MSDDGWVHVPELDGCSHRAVAVYLYALKRLPHKVPKVPKGVSKFYERRAWLDTIGPKLLRIPQDGYWEQHADGCWYFTMEQGYCFLRERDAFEFKMRFG